MQEHMVTGEVGNYVAVGWAAICEDELGYGERRMAYILLSTLGGIPFFRVFWVLTPGMGLWHPIRGGTVEMLSNEELVLRYHTVDYSTGQPRALGVLISTYDPDLSRDLVRRFLQCLATAPPPAEVAEQVARILHTSTY